jgi:G3E family GTPase
LIGVLVLTGFLGSGKTTLLQRLLAKPQFSRTAVIINEFGEIGIDHELVEASSDNLIQLTTGCICCKVRSDLAETLADMLRRREEGTVPAFTRVVIETSGLADPAPILQTLMTDLNLAGRLALNGLVTTVDALNGAVTLDREAISVKQVALADRLILTKSDLAVSDAAALHARLARLNRTAPLVTADHGNVDPDIFEIDSFNANAMSLADKSWARQLSAGPPDLNHVHDHDIKTSAIVRTEPIHAVTLSLFLEALAEHCGAEMLRLKGIVNIAESLDRPVVVHGVQHVFHPLEWLPRWPSADRRSRIVLIGRRIPRRWIELLLTAIEAEVQQALTMKVIAGESEVQLYLGQNLP